MSRSYHMQVRISGYERQSEIQRAAHAEWDFSDWRLQDGWLSSDQEGALAGGESKEEFADRLALAIWRANMGFARSKLLPPAWKSCLTRSTCAMRRAASH